MTGIIVSSLYKIINSHNQAIAMTMKMKSLFLMFSLSICVTQLSQAANITNKIIGVGPKDNLINPYFCIQDSNGQVTAAVAPGATADGNKASGNAYYVGGSLRFGGCTADNSYLGYVGFNVNDQHNNKLSTYSPPEGVHVTYANPAIDSAGNITGQIQYTPINPNFSLLPSAPSQNPYWSFVGANLSGLEFGKVIDPVVIPNLSQEDASGKFSDLTDTQAFLKAGINTFRLPVSWGYLQLDGPGKGDLNLDYYNSFIKPQLESLTSAHINTIVDLHAYMRYSVFGKQYSGCGPSGPCPDGTLILDANAYQDVWTKLYALVKSDSKINMNYILFDLVNEPVDVPDDLVFTIQAQVIKSLRQQGYQGYILLEGNSWTGLHSWTTASWASKDGKTTYTNASLFTRDNFIKAGINDLSKIIINVHQYLDSDYSGTHEQCLTNLNTVGPDGFNLSAFVNYLQQNKLNAVVTEFGAGHDSNTCVTALTDFLNYLKDNSAKNKDYGFVGWTIWSTGHGWGDYNLRVKPNSYQMQILRNYLQPM
jgi:endoglucanase